MACISYAIADYLGYTPDTRIQLIFADKLITTDNVKTMLTIIFDYRLDAVILVSWTPGNRTATASAQTGINSFYEKYKTTLARMYYYKYDELTSYYQELRSTSTATATPAPTATPVPTQSPLKVGTVSWKLSNDKQSIFLTKPSVTGGSGNYTIAYNIYDSNSNPVNYFSSLENNVAATPGYGGLFNVFVVVTDQVTKESNAQNIGWQKINWPYSDTLTVGTVEFQISEDRKSVYLTRPFISCKSGEVTVAYNIYDENSNPVNYFYSTDTQVAATPGYAGQFNVFVVVTDTVTGEQNVQNIGWQNLKKEISGLSENMPAKILKDPKDAEYLLGVMRQFVSAEALFTDANRLNRLETAHKKLSAMVA